MLKSLPSLKLKLDKGPKLRLPKLNLKSIGGINSYSDFKALHFPKSTLSGLKLRMPKL